MRPFVVEEDPGGLLGSDRLAWIRSKDLFLHSCPWYLLRLSPAIAEISEIGNYARQGAWDMSRTPRYVRSLVSAYLAGLNRGESERIKKPDDD